MRDLRAPLKKSRAIWKRSAPALAKPRASSPKPRALPPSKPKPSLRPNRCLESTPRLAGAAQHPCGHQCPRSLVAPLEPPTSKVLCPMRCTTTRLGLQCNGIAQNQAQQGAEEQENSRTVDRSGAIVRWATPLGGRGFCLLYCSTVLLLHCSISACGRNGGGGNRTPVPR